MEKIAGIYRISLDLPFPGVPDTRLPAAMHALPTADGPVLVDPFILEGPQATALEALGTPSHILITNQNHARDAEAYRTRYGARILAHAELDGYFPFSLDGSFADGETLPGDLTAVHLPGTFRGETALYHAAEGGSYVLGDALINIDLERYGLPGTLMGVVGWPQGLGTMPRLLMLDEETALASYERLYRHDFSRLLMSHGDPVRQDGPHALRAALENDNTVLPVAVRRCLSGPSLAVWDLIA